MEELERNVEPSWPKLVEPLEKLLDRLYVVWGMVNHLKAVKDNADLRSAIEDVQVCFCCSFLFFSWLFRSIGFKSHVLISRQPDLLYRIAKLNGDWFVCCTLEFVFPIFQLSRSCLVECDQVGALVLFWFWLALVCFFNEKYNLLLC